MTYSAPVLKVEVALEATPLDDFEAIATWTDLSARVLGFDMKRGRSDQLATFQTGTATITLDNEDRELDPQNPHGLVPALSRSVTDGVTTNTDATVTSATAIFRAEDVGKAISGAGIPAGATIATFTSATSVEISANATATATGVTLTIAGGRGLPFCPVRISLDYKGSNYKLMGRAFLGSEGWPGTRSPHGTEATVTLNVVDATGLFAWLGMPSSYWRAIVGQIVPDWWLPGEVISPADTADGFHVNNAAGTGGWATTVAANTRTVTDGVINTDTSLVSATAVFTNADVGRQVNGTGITVGTTIDSVTDPTEVVLSQATTATATGVTVLIGTTVTEPLSTVPPLSLLEPPYQSEVQGYSGAANYLLLTVGASGWQMARYVSLVSDEADVFPDGDEPDLTVSMMWKSTRYDDGSLTGDAESDLWRIEGTDVHLRCFLDGLDGGSINLQILDGSGVELTTITAPVPPTAGPNSYGDNWDDGDPHGIVVRVVGGTSVDLFVDSVRVTETTDVPSAAFAGDFIIGEVPGGATVAHFDEVTLTRRALTDTECERLATAPSAGITWGRGETMAERLALFYDAAGWTLLAAEDGEWHPPPASITSPDDPTLIGVAERGASWPKTLGEAVTRVANGVGGDIYALRNGKVRVRSLLATDDVALAAEYATSLAHLTDGALTGSPPPVRRGQVSYSGTRFDRTVTVAEVTFLALSQDGGNLHAYADAKWIEAIPNPYMPRTRTATLDTESRLVAQALALAFLDRYGTPGIEVGAVSLYPTRERSEALMDFIVTDLELERLVTLTDTPPVGDPITASLNVQGEAWKWSGTDLVVTLNLARS